VYAANNSTSSFDFYSLSVNPGGISLQADYDGAVSYNGAFGVRIHFDRGSQLIYIDNGLVLDPSSGLAKGAFAASGLMVPDSTVGRTFFLTKPADGSPGLSVEVFDLTHFTSITSITIREATGNPLSFIRWGPRGLAFCTDAGNIFLVTGGFVDGSG
jgi:hypothetical protein